MKRCRALRPTPTPAAAVLAASLVAPAAALALDPAKPITQYKLDVWMVEQGLPQNSINSMVQTRDGYLWLGTQEGVVRFDGAGFQVFNRRNTPALTSNYVWKLFEAHDGSLWIGTNGGGLTRYRDGRFTTLGTGDGLPDATVWAIQEGADGSVWAGTGGGLARWSGTTFSNWTVREGLPHPVVTALATSADGTLWVGTRSGLARLPPPSPAPPSPTAGTPAAPPTLQRVALGALDGSAVTALLVDRAGAVWIATSDGLGLLRDGKLDVYGTAQGLPSDHLLSVLEDRAGNLWAGTSGGGLARLREGRRFDSLGPAQGLSDASVRSLLEDWEGDLWVGTYGGLNRLKDEKFSTLTTRDDLSSNFILALSEDQAGAMWFGTYGGGLNRRMGDCVSVYTTRDGLADNTVSSLWPARDGSLWIGTYGKGLSHLAAGSFRSLRVRDGLASDTVLALLEDRHGTVWVGTEDGVSRVVGDRIETFRTADGLAGNAVYALLEDRHGAMWFGTSTGLSRLDGGSWTRIGRAQGLASEDILSLYEDAEGSLWIGTDGGGISRLRDGKIATWTTREGLFDEEAFAILEDDAGRLWVSCNEGVYSVAKKDLEVVAAGRARTVTCSHYGSADGMGTSECNGRRQPSGWKSRDGRLWFATIRGAAVVDPRNMPFNRLPPPVHLEQVRVDGEPMPAAARLELPPGHRHLEFRYTGLSFRSPRRVEFKYRLEPFDKDWVDAGTRRSAFYTNVPSGEYTFAVRARNSDGVWNEEGASLALLLRPRFVETRAFYALAAIAFVSVALAAHRIRVHRLEQRERELGRRVAESLARIKRLSGLLPICAQCKKIRDDRGYWNQIESYIRERSDAEFSHGICPDCARELYPQYTPREEEDEE